MIYMGKMINIEESKVPLVQSMTSNYDSWLLITGVLIIVIGIVYMLGSYIQLCAAKRQKVREYSAFYCVECYMGWNIFRLREEVRRLEWGAREL